MTNKITYEDFQKLEEIKERIMQLEHVKKYLSSIFDVKPFSMRIIIDTGLDYHVEVPFFREQSARDYHFLETEDAKYVLNSIDKRIAELKDEVFVENLSPENIPNQ